MNRYIHCTIAALFITVYAYGFAQNKPGFHISGSVMDTKGRPLAYANVFIAQTLQGSMTKESGEFSFVCTGTGDLTLICTYIGYRKHTRTLKSRPGSSISVTIVMDTQDITAKPVTVYASSFSAADEKGVTLTSMDVVRTPGTAADLFWAVKTLPGMQQVDEGAGLFVRGGDVSETAVFLDGALIIHPYKYESPTGGYFGTFNPFLLKGTYFSSGGFSARYGHALSGVLSMESRDIPGRKTIGIGIGLAAESAALEIPAKNGKLGFSFSGNISNTKMLFELNRCTKTFSRYPASFDVNFNTVYKPGPNTKIKLFMFRQDDKIGVEVDDPDYSTQFYGNGSNQLFNLQAVTLAAKHILIKANAAVSTYANDSRAGVLDITTKDKLLQARASAEYQPNADFCLRIGAELLGMRTDIAGMVPLTREDYDPAAPCMKIDTDYASDRTAGFIETEYLTPFGFSLVPGLRIEHESISGQTSADPRISAAFPLSGSLSVTAAWGVYHQPPRPEYFDPYIGNPGLGLQKSSHIIGGLAYTRDETIFRIECYYKKYSSLLLEDPSVNYTNDGHGYASGIDLFAKHRMGRFSAWASYSYLHTRRKWMDLRELASPYFDITHNATGVITVDLPRNLSAGCSFRYASGKPYTPGPGMYNTERVPPYAKADITLSWIHSFLGSDMTIVYAAVSNALNRINIFDYKYSADFSRRAPVKSSFGRSFYFGFQVNI